MEKHEIIARMLQFLVASEGMSLRRASILVEYRFRLNAAERAQVMVSYRRMEAA